MSIDPSYLYLDAIVIAGATMLLVHPFCYNYITKYTASATWTACVIALIIWCVSFIIIGISLIHTKPLTSQKNTGQSRLRTSNTDSMLNS
jgi:hypothetical protein